MEKEQIIKFILAGILLILLFFVGTGYTTTNYNNTSYINGTLDASDKINKTGDTVGNSFRLDTTDGNGYIATTTNSNIIGYNIGSLSTLRRSEYRGYPGYAQIYLRSGITTTRTYNFSLDGVDLDAKNISNCGNCVNKSETQYNNDMNAKLNKSDDVSIDQSFTSTKTQWFNGTVSSALTVFSRAGRTDFIRNFVASGINSSSAVNTFLQRANVTDALCLNGCGPMVIMSIQDMGLGALNVGRMGVYWENRTNNQSYWEYSTKNGSSDTGGTGNFFRFNGSDGKPSFSGLTGSGNAYTCVDSTGKLYRGNPTC